MTILHLDLDAFFASVEQRDKPSLKGKPVVVGGTGPRGVVATASYEARKFGIRSAMSGAEARRRAAGKVAFLGGRFPAYQESSRVVMGLLREISPLVEPLSLDEAYVDLTPTGWSPEELPDRAAWLRAELTNRTEGLTGSVGLGSSKLIAKLASEEAKPNGVFILRAGEELDYLAPLPVRALPGVGPATEQRLLAIGMYTVEDLRGAQPGELERELGKASGAMLRELALGRDSRAVSPANEAKSVSTEDTFQIDLTNRSQLEAILIRDANKVASRLTRYGLFARTVTLKVRFGTFETITRSSALGGATDDPAVIIAALRQLFDAIDVRAGVRLLGVGVSNFAGAAQDPLFGEEESAEVAELVEDEAESASVRGHGFFPGADVLHDRFGRGWVWGSGKGLVTVRFEYRGSLPGKIRTLSLTDTELQPTDPLALPCAGHRVE